MRVAVAHIDVEGLVLGHQAGAEAARRVGSPVAKDHWRLLVVPERDDDCGHAAGAQVEVFVTPLALVEEVRSPTVFLVNLLVEVWIEALVEVMKKLVTYMKPGSKLSAFA